MKKIVINGGNKLCGEIKISGSKNSAVALIPAAVLSHGLVRIDNVPKISDIDALVEILKYLGAKVEYEENTLTIDSSDIENKEIIEELAHKLRASYYFMGALLGKYKKVVMYFPGGCSIGKRPIDLHLKGFEALGAHITCENNKYTVTAEELRGSKIYLDVASVGATINIMLAAVYAKGTTIIENAAREPHIVNVAIFLNQMGAKISGAGTATIKIQGVKSLKGGFTEVVPDYIEAGTYIIAGAMMGNDLKISGVIPDHLRALLSKLSEMGANVKAYDDYVIASASDHLRSVNVKTEVYPGFPTDLQQPLSALLTCCDGTSSIEETIWENRFMHGEYLEKMGANIEIVDKIMYIKGPSKLTGCEVVATDLRAGACMVLAGLRATGTTVITNIEHILRGYDNIIEKLTNVGANIEILDD